MADSDTRDVNVNAEDAAKLIRRCECGRRLVTSLRDEKASAEFVMVAYVIVVVIIATMMTTTNARRNDVGRGAALTTIPTATVPTPYD